MAKRLPTCDAASQLLSLSISGEGTMVYNSYNWTAPTKVTLPGGGAKNYACDGLLRPTLIHRKTLPKTH